MLCIKLFCSGILTKKFTVNENFDLETYKKIIATIIDFSYKDGSFELTNENYISFTYIPLKQIAKCSNSIITFCDTNMSDRTVLSNYRSGSFLNLTETNSNNCTTFDLIFKKLTPYDVDHHMYYGLICNKIKDCTRNWYEEDKVSNAKYKNVVLKSKMDAKDKVMKFTNSSTTNFKFNYRGRYADFRSEEIFEPLFIFKQLQTQSDKDMQELNKKMIDMKLQGRQK